MMMVNDGYLAILVGGTPTPLKNMSSSVGMMKFPIYGEQKHLPNHQPVVVLNLTSFLHLLNHDLSRILFRHSFFRSSEKKQPHDKNTRWVCLKIGYIPNYSHLIGIMIINHWV